MEQDIVTTTEDAPEAMEEGDSSDSSDDEADAQRQQQIFALKKQIGINPFLYDKHVELIRLLKEEGDLESLREARQAMSKSYPLTEDLWLDWLKDESKLAVSAAEREQLYQLFDQAVGDYLSVPVWLEYAQFSIGGMGEDGGVEKIRAVFEKALTAVGLHVTDGATIWEAYREFENAILAGMQLPPGGVPSAEQQAQLDKQTDRVNSLFKRQLAVPLNDMEETLEEYKEWRSAEDESITAAYEKAHTMLDKLKPFEDALLTGEPPCLSEYQAYLEFVVEDGDPARIQCTYERAIKDNCLVADLWLNYLKYLDKELQAGEPSLAVHERSIRNCPWSSALWVSYLEALERLEKPHSQIQDVFSQALAAGFSEGPSLLHLWTAYVDYIRRRVKWDQDHEKELSSLRAVMDQAINHLQETFGLEGDPTCSLQQYWARLEAKYCKNMEKARELWNDIMQLGHGSQANMWLEFFNLERCYGDHKHCRKVLQKGLNSASDWPESIVDAYIAFEREEGTLDFYDIAVSRCESQMKRVNERRKQEAEKEQSKAGAQKKGKGGKQAGKQQADVTDRQGGRHQVNTGWKKQSRGSQQDGAQKQQQTKGKWQQQAPIVFVRPKKQTASSNELPDRLSLPLADADTQQKAQHEPEAPEHIEFKKPAIPALHAAGTKRKSAPPPGFPGFKKLDKPATQADSSEEPAEKKSKVEEVAAPPAASHVATPPDAERDARTVFVSNLSYSTDEDTVLAVFSKTVDVTEVRLIKNYQGKSKGYGYVELTDELQVAEALKLDRTPVEDRPMFVSRCKTKTEERHAFQYSNAMEKNKLFIRNLPFTCTKEALAELFSQHGKLKDVRLVTYRSGAPKGLAYVEYAEESDASQAVLKTDGVMIGEHKISVAISNPPRRKQPVERREEFTPALGGGKRESAERGKARTQLSLVPRAVGKSKPTPAPPAGGKSKPPDTTEPPSEQAQTKKMSNQDFRNMLLNK